MFSVTKGPVTVHTLTSENWNMSRWLRDSNIWPPGLTHGALDHRTTTGKLSAIEKLNRGLPLEFCKGYGIPALRCIQIIILKQLFRFRLFTKRRQWRWLWPIKRRPFSAVPRPMPCRPGHQIKSSKIHSFTTQKEGTFRSLVFFLIYSSHSVIGDIR